MEPKLPESIFIVMSYYPSGDTDFEDLSGIEALFGDQESAEAWVERNLSEYLNDGATELEVQEHIFQDVIDSVYKVQPDEIWDRLNKLLGS